MKYGLDIKSDNENKGINWERLETIYDTKKSQTCSQVVILWLPACFDRILEPWLIYYILPSEKAYAFIGSTLMAASIILIGEWVV